MVLIHGWSLYAGSVTCKVYPWGPVKYGLYTCYKQVVFEYIHVVFRAGLTVCSLVFYLTSHSIKSFKQLEVPEPWTVSLQSLPDVNGHCDSQHNAR